MPHDRLLPKDKRFPDSTLARCCVALALPCMYYSWNIDDDYEDGLPEACDKCLIGCSCLCCPTLFPSLCCTLQEENWCAGEQQANTTSAATSLSPHLPGVTIERA